MTITDISLDLWRELGEPTDISVAFIIGYFRSNIGVLNNLLTKIFVINATTLEIDPELTDDELVIFKKVFEIYYFIKVIRTNLGASAFTAILEVQNDGAVTRLVNRNEVAKTYITLKKDAMQELKDLLNAYHINSTTPSAVIGDDIFSPCPSPYQLGISRNGRTNKSFV